MFTSDLNFNKTNAQKNIQPFKITEEKFSSAVVPNDYCRTYKYGTTTIGVAEVQGKRYEQEDALVISLNEVKGFDQLSKTQQDYTLAVTFDEMQEKCGDHALEGSTGCTIIAYVQDQTLKTVTFFQRLYLMVMAVIKFYPL